MSQQIPVIKEPTTYKWRIDNISRTVNNQNNHRLRSDHFMLTRSDVECWLELETLGGPNNAFMTLFIFSDSFKRGLDEVVDFTFWIEGYRGERLARSPVTVERWGDARIYRHIVHRDMIYSPSNFMGHDIIYACCEIRPKRVVVVQPPAHHQFVHDKMASMRKSGVSGACTIHVGEETFTLDKIFLMAHSEVFECMFTSDMKEAKTGVVEIADFSAALIEAFIDYLYSFRVRNPDSFAEDLYVMASKYDISGLKDECAEHLIKTLDKSNIIGRFILAFVHGHEKLQKTVLTYLTKSGTDLDFPALLETEEWKQFLTNSPELANDVLKSVHSKLHLTFY